MRNNSTHATLEADPANGLAPEEFLRAQIYQLIAGPFSAPAGPELLDAFAAIGGDSSRLGQALKACAEAAANASPEAEDDAYHELFVGIGSGVLVPFGSYYLTGFLHEKPLARLRRDMAAIGVEHNPDIKEPEDHISSVLEMMAGLIEGRFGAPASLSEQKKFFDAHVGVWAPHFFKDLSETKQSAFYAAVGVLGSIFMEIEAKAFEYD
ncbi:MAG: molecular chaperone TorD family protein [Alphaproteobacteria bacterium]|nr:molecular chaperone TorD family protein [Alphaproteobacteria bacterium]